MAKRARLRVPNHEIAGVFERVADLLDIGGENPFRIRAYRNAARVLDNLNRSLADMVAENEALENLPGIGKDLAGKIKEIVTTGELKLLKELSQKIPLSLASLMTIPSLGPRKIKILHEKLKIENLSGLKRALQKGKIRELPGFGEKTEARLLEEVARLEKKRSERFLLARAESIAEPILEFLRSRPGVKKVVAAGSYRRRKETVGDLDILVTCGRGSTVMDDFVTLPEVVEVLAHGPTRSTVILRSGLQVDLRAVAEASYGAALYYFTGSKSHNIAVRGIAQRKGLKINEYGVFRGKKPLAGKTEEEVFQCVGLPFIPPELRENQGEIEAAQKKTLPRLIETKDIRGDLHAHSRASDGGNSIAEMAEAARSRGYSYLAITDHTQSLKIANGLDQKRFFEQFKEIDAINGKWNDFVILKSAEVDILEDGTLDLPESVLKELDLAVCSLHSHFSLPRDEQTERILRAMDSPYFSIFGHPSARLLNGRGPVENDFELILKAAKERGIALEINCQPQRLDLNDIAARKAKEMGVALVISTDAHNASALDDMKYGVGQARRAWLEAPDVLNTRPWSKLQKLLRRHRERS